MIGDILLMISGMDLIPMILMDIRLMVLQILWKVGMHLRKINLKNIPCHLWFWKISHDPLVPGRFQTFTINVNVVDDGEIEYVLAHFYANGNIFEDNFIELFDDGLYGDAIANDGIFGQEYPFTTGVSFLMF